MRNITLITFIIFINIIFTPLTIYAADSAQSNTVITQFGNAPQDQKPVSKEKGTLPSSPTLTSIQNWDQRIVDSLTTGTWGYFNSLGIPITNTNYSTGTWSGYNDGIYWCTYSIVDSYNLAGITGLSKSSHGAVVNMRQFWQGPQGAGLGYKYLDYPGNNNFLSSAQPGYVIFMESVAAVHTGSEHVNMIKVLSADSRGNGFIDTNDSNSSKKSNHYPVVEWSIKNTPYAVRGLGGI